MRISDWSSDVCSSDLGLAGRYAVALFDLARESNAINAVLKSLGDLKAGLAESADLHTLVTSPIVGRTDAANAIGAVAKAMKLDSLTTKFLGVLAENRRLADRSEEHTSELQSLMRISYAVLCLKKKKQQ